MRVAASQTNKRNTTQEQHPTSALKFQIGAVIHCIGHCTNQDTWLAVILQYEEPCPSN